MSQETQRLKKGQIVSHYEIVQRLGAGGMGEVYLAEDTHLGRKVALKLLLDQTENNQDFLRRFKLEARAASALNHPNIITIYQIGEWENANFIAMEFVEGSNLRSLVKNRRLETVEILDVTIQTASALAAAHAAGIIHRDVKPENIMLRPDGLVKVLDFGLAKHADRAQPSRPPERDEIDSEAATREHLSTIPGLVMGTAQYMSPEQARGKAVDARSDIWSLGVVLYEMITGRPPFDGETKSDTLASILKTEPEPLSVFAPDVPLELERIIKKALGKDRDERYQHIKDMLLDLKILQGELTGVVSGGVFGGSAGSISNPVKSFGAVSSSARAASGSAALSPPGGASTGARKTAPHTSGAGDALRTENIGRNNFWMWVALSALLVLAVAAGVWYFRQPAAVASDANFPASLASSQVTSWKSELGELNAAEARFSPDGRLVAYVASKNGTSSVWIKQINGGEAFTRRQDDAAESSPLWSPDGERIAYYSDRGGRRGVWTSPALGGSPQLLAPVEAISRLVRWTKNGATIYFEMRENLYALDVATKQITKLTNFDEFPVQRGFAVSPAEEGGGGGGERIVYADRKDGQRDLWTADKNGANPVRLTNDAAEDSNPVWSADGQRIVYSSNRNGVKQIWMAYLDTRRPPVQLIFSDSDSSVTDVSPDGTKMLYTTTKDDSDLWGVPLNVGPAREFQVTSDIGIELWQDVSPDGETVAYQTGRTASGSSKLLHCLLLTQKIKEEGRRNQVAEDGFAARWSPDGRRLAFLRSEAGSSQSLWTASASGGDARPVTQNGVTFGGYSALPYNRVQTQDFQWSADGRSLVYCATRGGVSNIWQAAADAPSPDEKQLTANGDKNLLFFNPTLAPDGSGRLAWLGMALTAGGGGEPRKAVWSVWVSAPGGKPSRVYQSESLLGLLGWSESGAGLIIKSVEQARSLTGQPATVNILQIPAAAGGGEGGAAAGAAREIARLGNAYFLNIRLSPDRKTLAFVSRAGDNDAIQTTPAAAAGGRGTPPKTLVESNDSRVYFSGLTFAPDGKTLYYGKQANWQVVSMITNFK